MFRSTMYETDEIIATLERQVQCPWCVAIDPPQQQYCSTNLSQRTVRALSIRRIRPASMSIHPSPLPFRSSFFSQHLQKIEGKTKQKTARGGERKATSGKSSTSTDYPNQQSNTILFIEFIQS